MGTGSPKTETQSQDYGVPPPSKTYSSQCFYTVYKSTTQENITGHTGRQKAQFYETEQESELHRNMVSISDHVFKTIMMNMLRVLMEKLNNL